MANLSLDKKVYGGLAMDACVIPMVATAITPNQNTDDFPLLGKLLFGAGMIIDMPLTLVGDTLTLPITIPAAYRRFTTDFESFAKHSDEATPPPQNEDSCSINPPHLEPPTESAPAGTKPNWSFLHNIRSVHDVYLVKTPGFDVYSFAACMQ